MISNEIERGKRKEKENESWQNTNPFHIDQRNKQLMVYEFECERLAAQQWQKPIQRSSNCWHNSVYKQTNTNNGGVIIHTHSERNFVEITEPAARTELKVLKNYSHAQNGATNWSAKCSLGFQLIAVNVIKSPSLDFFLRRMIKT